MLGEFGGVGGEGWGGVGCCAVWGWPVGWLLGWCFVLRVVWVFGVVGCVGLVSGLGLLGGWVVVVSDVLFGVVSIWGLCPFRLGGCGGGVCVV